MRIDKFLKVSRLVKRRTVAKVLADKEKFEINGKIAKPSSQVKLGDTIDLYLGRHHIKVLVRSIQEIAKAKECNDMYDVLLDETLEERD